MNAEWTEKTWNHVTGCAKISSGCLHCYAEQLANGYPKLIQNRKYETGFILTLQYASKSNYRILF